MDDSEGSAIENASSSPERKKSSPPSKPTRGTVKRGRGRPKRIQKSASDNEASQNGGQQVASLKHVGKFRYLSNLTQSESTESEPNQLETNKSSSTRGRRGSGRGRGRGRGAAVQPVSTPQTVIESSNHVSSRGRRIKPNSRWAPDADFEPSPPKPIRGNTRRSTARGAKRAVEGDIENPSETLAEGCAVSLSDRDESSTAHSESVDKESEAETETKANGNLDDSIDDGLVTTEVLQSSSPLPDPSSVIVVSEDAEIASDTVGVTVELSQIEESAVVVEVVSDNIKIEECFSSADQDLVPATTETPNSCALEDEGVIGEVTVEINDEVFSVPCAETITSEMPVPQTSVATSTASCEHESTSSPPPDADARDACNEEDIAIENEHSITSTNDVAEPIPESALSSASNTPKHDDDADAQSILQSPKPVKVKSRWRRTSELEQVIWRPKPETASHEGARPATPETSEYLQQEISSSKCNDVSDTLSDLDNKSVVEERLKSVEIIDENRYLTNRKTSKEVKRMLCDCTLTKEEVARGELGCGEDCINRLLMIECGTRCQLSDRCTNKRFQKRQYAKLEVFNAGKKGVGLRALEDLSPGDFIIEYVGEVIDPREFHKRAKEYAKDKNKHYYFMALKSDAIIDATMQGNISRFINHSCDPNAETQKWTVNGDLRVGFFVRKYVEAGEELTFDYQFQRYGKEAQRCYCESDNCRGWIGEDPEKEEKGREKKERKDKRKKSTFRDEVNTIDLETEIEKLAASGVKNRAQTLNLSRLMVRAEDPDTRKSILAILRNAEQPCRRLFLDYHGLKLLWGWMVDVSAAGNSSENSQFKLDLLSTLSSLPVPNKTMVLDSKVLPIVEKWASAPDSVNEGEKPESNENGDSVDKIPDLSQQVISVATQLLETWSSLKEVFRIPKKERIEEMKEHEREADREADGERIEAAADSVEDQVFKTSSYDRRPSNYVSLLKDKDKLKRSRESPDREARKSLRIENDSLTKEERRRLFALKVAQQEEELRARKNQEDVWRRHLEQCLSLTLETAVPPGSFEATPCIAPTSPGFQVSLPQVFWDPVMGKWQPCAEDGVPISNPALTPLSESSSSALPKMPTEPPLLHLVIPKGYDPTSMGPLLMDFDASEFEATGIPYVPACLVVQQPNEETPQDQKANDTVQTENPVSKLPRFWRQAMDDRGRTYYYHVKLRLPQWEPPTPEGNTPDFSSEEEEVEEETPQPELEPLLISIPENPKESERTSRRSLLCKEKVISPRSDFERSDDAQRYRELKERLLRHKLSRIRERGLWVDESKVEQKGKHRDRDRRRLSEKEKEKLRKRAKEKYKRSLHKTENRKRVKEQPPVEPSTSAETVPDAASLLEVNDSITEKDITDTSMYDDSLNFGDGEDEASEQARNRDVSANTVRKIKDAFRMKISSDIVNILNPYRRPDCKLGRITCTDDFKHLARKMTHFVLAKELKHCRNIEDLVVNDSVKHKAKDFIKKYMMKFGPAYKRGNDDDA